MNHYANKWDGRRKYLKKYKKELENKEDENLATEVINIDEISII